MSDPGQELIQAAAREVAKAIVTPFARMWDNTVNGLIGDRIAQWREDKIAYRTANASDVGVRAGKLISARAIEPDPETPPEHIEEILEASASRSENEIKEAFAKLLASAVDPNRRKGYRREFVKTIAECDPLDALVFSSREVESDTPIHPSRREAISQRLQIASDEVQLSFEHLVDLKVFRPYQVPASTENWPVLTTYGRALVKFLK